jgi:hypothetical protein
MCHHTSNSSDRRVGASGYSLVELMVSMGLTLGLLAAAFALFDGMMTVSDAAVTIAEMNQNLRATVNVISRDLTVAGAEIPIGGIAIPGGSGSGPVTRPGPGALTFPVSSGVLSVITPGYSLGPTVGNLPSDIITILMIDPLSQLDEYPLTDLTPSGSQIEVDSRTDISGGASQVVIGDILMISNNRGATLGMVTNVNYHTNKINFASSDPLNLNQPSASHGRIADLQDPGPPASYPPTVAKKLTLTTYFLDNSNSSRPMMMRQIGAAPANPVALYITALQFSYDLSDGVTVNQRDTTTPNEIRKVNLLVSARSEARSRRSGQYFANSIFTSVTIRNLAYRDKY